MIYFSLQLIVVLLDRLFVCLRAILFCLLDTFRLTGSCTFCFVCWKFYVSLC